MGITAIIGAVLVACGVFYMVIAALYRGRLSEPRSSPRDPAAPTLEPRHRSMAFFGVKSNWAGIGLVLIGALLLMAPLF